MITIMMIMMMIMMMMMMMIMMMMMREKATWHSLDYIPYTLERSTGDPQLYPVIFSF